MQMSDGTIHQLNDAQMKELQKQRVEMLMGASTQSRDLMQMNKDQIKATTGMSKRKARRYMLKQPCDCGSGRQARKCCFKKF